MTNFEAILDFVKDVRAKFLRLVFGERCESQIWIIGIGERRENQVWTNIGFSERCESQICTTFGFGQRI